MAFHLHNLSSFSKYLCFLIFEPFLKLLPLMAFCPHQHPINPIFAGDAQLHCCCCFAAGAVQVPQEQNDVQSSQSSNGVPPRPTVGYDDVRVTCSTYFDPLTATFWIDAAIWDFSDGEFTLIDRISYQQLWFHVLAPAVYPPNQLPPFL